jgi:hypothetical protein
MDRQTAYTNDTTGVAVVFKVVAVVLKKAGSVTTVTAVRETIMSGTKPQVHDGHPRHGNLAIQIPRPPGAK